MPDRLDDNRVRIAAFQWLEEQVGLHGDVFLKRMNYWKSGPVVEMPGFDLPAETSE